MTVATPTVVFIPGLRDHVPDHWQTLLAEQLPGSITVPRMSGDKLSCAAWVEQIEQTLAGVDGPVLLVAHSAGAIMLAHWAQKYRRAIHGALLATPADVELPMPAGYPTIDVLRDNGWLPVPRTPLPFRSIVVASTNDPLGDHERMAQYAADWGSVFVNAGAVGHLNPAAGFGAWPHALELLQELGAQAHTA